MKKYTLFLILSGLSFLCIQTAHSQLYEGNAFYDSNGKVYYYATDGNAYYYPEEVQRQYQRRPQVNSRQTANYYDRQPNYVPIKENNLLDANWWKTATLESVKEEIAKGTDVNAVSPDRAGENSDGDLRENVTPLMFALKYGKPSSEVIQTLIDAGADINAKEKVTGLTVLMYAIDDTTDVNIIENLIKSGANIEAKQNDGWTALMLAAAKNQNPEVIKTLLKHGADIDDLNILMAAHRNPNKEVTNLIISEIEKSYREADYSDRSDFDSRVSKCVLQEEFEQDFHSSLSIEDQFTLGVTSLFSLGMKDSQRTKECQCIFNAVEAYLGESEYKRVRNAFNQGRQGTFKKAVKSAIPAAFGVCF